MRRLDTPPYAFALREEVRLRGLFDRALRESVDSSGGGHSLLRDAVCEFVRQARTDGHQVETVIVALKEIFAMPDRPRSAIGDEDSPPPTLLARRAIGWCISEYYSDGPPRRQS